MGRQEGPRVEVVQRDIKQRENAIAGDDRECTPAPLIQTFNRGP